MNKVLCDRTPVTVAAVCGTPVAGRLTLVMSTAAAAAAAASRAAFAAAVAATQWAPHTKSYSLHTPKTIPAE